MTINLQMTDTEHNIGTVSCVSEGAVQPSLVASVGATAGTGTTAPTDISGQATQARQYAKCEIAEGTTWGAGTFMVPIDVTTSNMFLTLVEVLVCRVNSSDTVQESMGTATVSESLASEGVISVDVTVSAQTPDTGDYVLVTLDINNTNMNGQGFAFANDQVLVAPFTASGGGLGIPIAAYHHFHHNLA